MAFSVYANAEEKASARRVTPSNRKENSSSCVHVFDETSHKDLVSLRGLALEVSEIYHKA